MLVKLSMQALSTFTSLQTIAKCPVCGDGADGKVLALISANAANAAGAAGLEDSGHNAPNYQADFLLYHIPDNPPQMVAVLRKDESIQLLDSWRF